MRCGQTFIEPVRTRQIRDRLTGLTFLAKSEAAIVERLSDLRLLKTARTNGRTEMLDRIGVLAGLVGLNSCIIELLAGRHGLGLGLGRAFGCWLCRRSRSRCGLCPTFRLRRPIERGRRVNPDRDQNHSVSQNSQPVLP